MFFSSENLFSLNCSYHKGKLLVIRNLPFLGGGLIWGVASLYIGVGSGQAHFHCSTIMVKATPMEKLKENLSTSLKVASPGRK